MSASVNAPTRRTTLGFSVAAITTGLAPSSGVVATSPDAAIIALCHRLVAIEAEANLIYAQRLTIADEHRTEPTLVAIEARRDAAVAALERLDPPRTLAGIKAVARASLATHSHKDSDGAVVPICDGHWMALTVCECLTIC